MGGIVRERLIERAVAGVVGRDEAIERIVRVRSYIDSARGADARDAPRGGDQRVSLGRRNIALRRP